MVSDTAVADELARFLKVLPTTKLGLHVSPNWIVMAVRAAERAAETAARAGAVAAHLATARPVDGA